jgi:tetratricopeptide (TPR) repeat protein
MSEDASRIQLALGHEGRAEDLLDELRYEEALVEADSALAITPNSVAALIVRASACKAIGKFWEAADTLEVLLAKMPGLVDLRVNIANIYAELERFSKAEGHLKIATNLSPSSAEAFASLGSVYIRMARYDLAEAPTRYALSLDPSNLVANQNHIAIEALKQTSDAGACRSIAAGHDHIFVEKAYCTGAPVALILSSAGEGNVPTQHLLPRAKYGRISWYLDHVALQEAGELPAHDFVFNAIGDLDAAPSAHDAAQRFAAHCQRPLINRPECVARTGRSSTASMLGQIDNVVAPVARLFLGADGDIGQAILSSALRFPLIVRPAGKHGGIGAKRADSPAELIESLPGCDAVYATEFVDYLNADGWYRKYRVILVDRRPYPCHLAIGDHWLLHYWSSGMEADAQRRDEELRFLCEPETAIGASAWAALSAIGAKLDLDYAGIDFSVLADGRLLFFEANATMLVHPEDEVMFAYKNSAVRSIIEAVGSMIERKLQICR